MDFKPNSYNSNYLNSEKTQLWTMVSLCLLYVGVGVPIWWKTTEVYRATLPYEEIKTLHDNLRIYFKVAIEIENTVPVFDAVAFSNDLKTLLHQDDDQSKVRFFYKISTFVSDNMTLDSEASKNVIRIVFKMEENKNFMLKVTDKRVVFCYLTKTIISDVQKIKQLQEKINYLIKNYLIKTELVSEMLMNKAKIGLLNSQEDLFRKAVKTNTKFELVFSLLCPEPENILAQWDISKMVDEYVKPMVEKLQPVFQIDIGSQILYFVKISYRPKISKLNGSRIYYVMQDQLSHVINPIEAKLGSQLSSNPTMNFAVYVVEKNRIPLYIKKNDKLLSKTNSFLVPRWGAMMFYNFNELNDTSDYRRIRSVNMNRVLNSFLGPFRTLLGIPSFSHLLLDDVYFEQPIREGLTDWELDYLMRLRLTENIASATHTLYSLSKLLSKISNIVINDQIANEIYSSVNAIVLAKKLASQGNLTDALRQSKIAFNASETAFFDPTLLELLYFPEDQKFAIYVPLFFPISLPLLVSIIKKLKRYKRNEKPKTE